MRPAHSNQRGITVMELMVAIGIFAIVVVPISALVYKSQMARHASQESLYSQQEGAVVLSRFTDDVRSSTSMTSPLSQSTAVTMRQPTSLTTFTYVTWRLADGKLQRGESASATSLPTAWQDVIDPGLFTVEAGRFAFYTLNNGTPKTNTEARRLELRELVLKSKTTGSQKKPPAYSAVMREAAQTRSMAVTSPWETWGNDNSWHSSVHIRFQLKNLSDNALSLGAFAATWDDQQAGGYIKSMDLSAVSSSSWGGGQSEYRSGGVPQTLDQPLSVAPGGTVTVELHVIPVQELTSFTMSLYDAADTARATPYVLKVK